MKRDTNMKKKLIKSMLASVLFLFFTVCVSKNETFASCPYPSVSTNASLELVAFRDINVYISSSLSTGGKYSPWRKYSTL